MIDYSFLRLKDNIADAKNIGDSPTTTHYFFNPIQLIPDKTYLQITNYDGGISLTSDCEVFVVDCDDNVLADITNNTFIEEFVDNNGNNQCSIEFVNLTVDFYRTTVLIRFNQLTSDAVWWSNPINITAYQSNKTVFFKYKNYDDFMGIGYSNANKWQSISLSMYFDIPIDETETEDYFQISRNNTISARALIKLFERYQIEQINRFTFERLNILLKHELIYLDDVRVTNKPVVNSDDRQGDSNIFETNFTVAKNYNDISFYDYQIFTGLELTQTFPDGTYVLSILPPDGRIIYNLDVTLNTGTVTIYDASDNSVVSVFTESDMSVNGTFPNRIDIPNFTADIIYNGNYYVHISAGLVSALGIDSAIVNDNTTWTITTQDADFNDSDFNNVDFLTV